MDVARNPMTEPSFALVTLKNIKDPLMDYIEVDGHRIPVVSMAEVVKPVFEYFERSPGDEGVKADILRALRQAIESGDVQEMRRFLSDDPALWLGTLQDAYFFKDRQPLSGYPEWAKAKCDLLVEVVRRTRDDDGIIQHILNYEDFHVEVMPFPFGPRFVVEIYDQRGLDFFLFHYMGGETDAHSDEALFEHASCVATALGSIGRQEEAKDVSAQLRARRQRLEAIAREFEAPNSHADAPALNCLRIRGERFWFDYLSEPVWRALAEQSRRELLDVFATEYLLRAEVLTTWSSAALILCKVLEREAVETFFSRWKTNFAEGEFVPPSSSSKRLQRRIDSRRVTFDVLHRAARGQAAPPTLGQLVFLTSFWDDDVMDSCTPVFSDIRLKAEQFDPEHSKHVQRLTGLLKEPLSPAGQIEVSVVQLRNESAHPQPDQSADWEHHVAWLKQALGEPPRQILRLVTVDTRVPMQT